MRYGWSVLAIAVMTLGLAHAGEDLEDVKPTQFPAEIDADLHRLAAPEFKEREEAARRLLARKLEAVAALTHLAETGKAESAVRAFDLLRQLYREGDDATNDAVESAFETLAESDNSTVALRAVAAMEAGAPIRRTKAMAAFRKAGGVLKFAADSGDGDESTRPISHAILDPKKWTGGDEGLKYLRRIDDFRTPADRRSGLIVIKGVKVSRQAIDDLQFALPTVLVQERGPAQLGISPYSLLGGPARLQIGEVTPGSAAERAGLRIGDVIHKFNGHDVPDFPTLVERISEKQPGDKVPVIYERNGVEATLIVELQGWE